MTRVELPIVSVIVPARNEEACLGRCLQSLVSQQGIPLEIIVVDDASTDRTGEIARSLVGRESAPITVMNAPPLPDNWTGKNNAMSAGAKIAKGKWLLFTDADTFHKAGSLARAVAEAEEQGAALLSYSPEQEMHTFFEKAVMPVIFAELAITYPPAKVRDPQSPVAAANGQYLMILSQVYDEVGGHAKIASDLLEDVAMARLVKSSGGKIWFRYGGDAVLTRMYRNWSQMKEGWTKNLALLFPKPAKLAWRRLWEFMVLLLLPLSLLQAAFWKPFLDNSNPGLMRWHFFAREVVFCIAFAWWTVAFVVRMRKSHASWPRVVLGFLGLPIFAYLLMRSHRAYQTARFDWKDRSYIYSREEVSALTHAESGQEPSGAWRRFLARVFNSGNV